jgi:hypothetical protein
MDRPDLTHMLSLRAVFDCSKVLTIGKKSVGLLIRRVGSHKWYSRAHREHPEQ